MKYTTFLEKYGNTPETKQMWNELCDAIWKPYKDQLFIRDGVLLTDQEIKTAYNELFKEFIDSDKNLYLLTTQYLAEYLDAFEIRTDKTFSLDKIMDSMHDFYSITCVNQSNYSFLFTRSRYGFIVVFLRGKRLISMPLKQFKTKKLAKDSIFWICDQTY